MGAFINGSTGSVSNLPKGTCTTAVDTAAKTVTVSPSVTSLTAGLSVMITFQYANNASNPTLNVNGLGAKVISAAGTQAVQTDDVLLDWGAYETLIFTYNGTYWVMSPSPSTVTDLYITTYDAMIRGQDYVTAGLDSDYGSLGNCATAEGYNVDASGDYSHAEGERTVAFGLGSHAEGQGTIALGSFQHVFGVYNEADYGPVEIVGCGFDDSNRANIRTLDWNGNEVLAGKLTLGAAPTANMDAATKQYVDNAVSGVKDYTVITTNLLASSWNTSTGIYSALETQYPSSQYDLFLQLNSSTVTSAQYEAFSKAQIIPVLDTNQLKALGTIPTIDIPVYIRAYSV